MKGVNVFAWLHNPRVKTAATTISWLALIGMIGQLLVGISNKDISTAWTAIQAILAVLLPSLIPGLKPAPTPDPETPPSPVVPEPVTRGRKHDRN